MTEAYLSVGATSYHEYFIERSRFIAEAHYVASEDIAIKILEETKKRYSDATHVCHAYVLGIADNIYRFSDDGEPSKTAGMPILEAIRGRGLYHTLITVTRYFGGIKLGAGGLVRAYSAGAIGAINNASIKKYFAVQNFDISLSYEMYAVCSRYINGSEDLIVKDIEYGEIIVVKTAIKQQKSDEIIAKITDLCKGSAEFVSTTKCFTAFEK